MKKMGFNKTVKKTEFFLKFFPLTLCLLIVLLFFRGSAVFCAEVPEVRVKISLTGNFVDLTFDSGYTLLNIPEGTPLPLAPGRYLLLSAGGNIQILDNTGSCRGIYTGPLYLQPLSSAPAEQFFQLHNASFGREYRGALEIFLEGQTLAAVNVLELEAYLRGVLPREVPPSWGNYGGMEALKAQGVASRSYTLYHLQRGRHTGYHLCDTQHCQVYGGKSSETENTNSALEQTRGEILTYNGLCIEAFYHASNGGFTEVPENVWRNPLPYYDSAPDPFDHPDNPLGLNNFVQHRYARWKKDLPREFLQLFLASRGINNSGAVEKVEVRSFFPSGRVEELRIQEAGGKALSLFKGEARTALGLRSQLFTVRRDPEPHVWIASAPNGLEKKEPFGELEGKWVIGGQRGKKMLMGERFAVRSASRQSFVPYLAFIFEGNGWGHGIGLSQNGAYNRSRAGQNYREILSFYYPGTAVEKRY